MTGADQPAADRDADRYRALAASAVVSGLPHVLGWSDYDSWRWRERMAVALNDDARRAAVTLARVSATDDRTLLLTTAAHMLTAVVNSFPSRDRRHWLNMVGDPSAFLGPAAAVVDIRPPRPSWHVAVLGACTVAAALAAIAWLGWR